MEQKNIYIYIIEIQMKLKKKCKIKIVLNKLKKNLLNLK